MTAITHIANHALHAATKTAPKAATAIAHSAAPLQALEQAVTHALPTATDIAQQPLQSVGQQLAGHINKLTGGPGSLTVGKALLTLAAGILAFFFIGPLALKFAARSAGFLFRSAATCTRACLNPQFLSKAAQKGLMFFATLETALPFINPLLKGTPISHRLVGLSSKVAQFGQQLTENAPRIAQMAGNVAGPEAGKAVELITGPQVTGLLQRASQFLKRLANAVPELAQQTAKTA